MATITSAQSGNWSDTATWVGSVVPTINDDVIISGGHLVDADVDINVLSISSSSNGQLLVTTSRNIICTGSGIITSSTGNISYGLINITAGLGEVVNITSDIIALGSGGKSSVYVDGIATVNIIGFIDALNGSFNSYGVYIKSVNSNVNIIGNVLGGAGNTWAVRIISTAGNTHLSVSGIISPGGASATPAIRSDASSIIDVNGIINSTSTAAAITSSTLVIVSGVLNNVNSRLAVSTPLMQLSSTSSTSWLFQTNSNDKTLYTADALTGYPLEKDVEDGVVYGPSDEFEGTLSPVVVDTAQLAVNLLDEIQTSSHVVAQRLRNSQTPEINQQQLTATLGG